METASDGQHRVTPSQNCFFCMRNKSGCGTFSVPRSTLLQHFDDKTLQQIFPGNKQEFHCVKLSEERPGVFGRGGGGIFVR